jgi:GTPase SAR1 family protein
MEQLIFNKILEREEIAMDIRNALVDFEKTKKDLLNKRGFYIYGAPGSGKTSFVMRLLKEAGYDIVRYDAGDIRNKTIIETIAKNNMAEKNIVSLFQKKAQPIAIVMDEIDGMNNGDKGGINALIRLIRPKKTKKQRTEETTNSPIICISNYHVDKKIKELMKVCYSFELKTPTLSQVSQILTHTMPELDASLKISIRDFVQGDLKKLQGIHRIHKNQRSILKNEIIQNILKPKSYSEDTKEITRKLLKNDYPISEHLTLMNDTDRTIVGLLWHENVVDILEDVPCDTSFPLYQKVIDNVCFADYIDRVTFQKQIWQFNEMSSLMKTFHTNRMLHQEIEETVFNPCEVRFTKVLTKYSTEYNNTVFINELCQHLGLDKKDMLSFFMKARETMTDEEIYAILEPNDISKLDMNRIYRYLDKYTREPDPEPEPEPESEPEPADASN